MSKKKKSRKNRAKNRVASQAPTRVSTAAQAEPDKTSVASKPEAQANNSKGLVSSETLQYVKGDVRLTLMLVAFILVCFAALWFVLQQPGVSQKLLHIF